ncbi:MAG: hypothetical protein ACTJFS_14675 [Micrococcaceae bacterium]
MDRSPWELNPTEFTAEERRERTRGRRLVTVLALIVIAALLCSTLIGLFI